MASTRIFTHPGCDLDDDRPVFEVWGTFPALPNWPNPLLREATFVDAALFALDMKRVGALAMLLIVPAYLEDLGAPVGRCALTEYADKMAERLTVPA